MVPCAMETFTFSVLMLCLTLNGRFLVRLQLCDLPFDLHVVFRDVGSAFRSVHHRSLQADSICNKRPIFSSKKNHKKITRAHTNQTFFFVALFVLLNFNSTFNVYLASACNHAP